MKSHNLKSAISQLDYIELVTSLSPNFAVEIGIAPDTTSIGRRSFDKDSVLYCIHFFICIHTKDVKEIRLSIKDRGEVTYILIPKDTGWWKKCIDYFKLGVASLLTNTIHKLDSDDLIEV